ncbi:MAG: hypothetical protein DSY33_03450 [Archaeoglobus sp.]|nr:MAG: hypothetical protein DSY33_03450 [Archaeoglobus sp.]
MGGDNLNVDVECPKCGGKVRVVDKLEKNKRAVYFLECPKCGGKGKLIRIGEIGTEILDFE